MLWQTGSHQNSSFCFTYLSSNGNIRQLSLEALHKLRTLVVEQLL